MDGLEGNEALCYAVVMRRPGCFLLWLPVSFIPDDVLVQGQQAAPDEMVGRSQNYCAAVQLSDDGDWTARRFKLSCWTFRMLFCPLWPERPVAFRGGWLRFEPPWHLSSC